jgi:phospholipid transport system substrate-binding protein
MSPLRTLLTATALVATSAATLGFAAPAQAAVSTADPGAFVDTLADEGFAVLRKGANSAASKQQFRAILSQHFAVDAIGDRLITRWRAKITPAQYQAYKAAFPSFLIGAYADRLQDYSTADLKVVRQAPRGNSTAVLTSVTKPGGGPIQAVWVVDRVGGGYKVSNLTVAGINLAVTQAQDFDSFIQRRGFDALVQFMRSKAA